jgi:hypothetical protein
VNIGGNLRNKAWGLAQMVDCLPSKCEVLTSNPSTAKKKKKKERKEKKRKKQQKCNGHSL